MGSNAADIPEKSQKERFEELFGIKPSGIPRLQDMERRIVARGILALHTTVENDKGRLAKVEQKAKEIGCDQRQLHEQAVIIALALDSNEAVLGEMKRLAKVFRLEPPERRKGDPPQHAD